MNKAVDTQARGTQPGSCLQGTPSPSSRDTGNSQLRDRTEWGACFYLIETDPCKKPEEGFHVVRMGNYLTWPERAGIAEKPRKRS